MVPASDPHSAVVDAHRARRQLGQAIAGNAGTSTVGDAALTHVQGMWRGGQAREGVRRQAQQRKMQADARSSVQAVMLDEYRLMREAGSAAVSLVPMSSARSVHSPRTRLLHTESSQTLPQHGDGDGDAVSHPSGDTSPASPPCTPLSPVLSCYTADSDALLLHSSTLSF